MKRSLSPFTSSKNYSNAIESPILRASTNYMETVQQMMPISGGSDISAFLNDNQQLDLYSVGTASEVFRLRPGVDNYGPYEISDLGIKASQLALFTTLETSPNNPSILGVDSSNKLTLSTYTNGSYDQKVFQPANATEKIKQFLAVKGPTGNIYANVMLDDGKSPDNFLLGNNFFNPIDEEWASTRWAPVKGPDGEDARVIDIAMCSNSLTQSSLFAIGSNQQVWFNEDNFAFSEMKDLGFLKVTDLSVVLDQDELLNIFAIEEGTGCLWVKKQKKYSTDGIQFEDWEAIGGSTKLSRIYAAMRYDNLLEIFAIGEDGLLYHNNQSEPNKNSEWSQLFPLGNQVGNSIFTVTNNADGYSEAFTVTNDNQIGHFWQDPETTQWFSETIKAENPEQIAVSLPTHSLIITVLDKEGVPQPNTMVEIATSFLTSLNINGLAYQASAVRSVKPVTDLSGNLNIVQEATSLSAASILISTPFTTLGQPIQVQPNAQLQFKMYNTTWEDVYNATDGSGNYLLGDERTEDNAKSMASIMNASMSLGMGDDAAPVQYFVPSKGSNLGWSPKMDVSRVKEQHWEIDFTSKFPMYKDLDASSAALRIESFKSNINPDLALSGIWEDFTNFWGNFWQAIKEGVEAIWEGIQNIVITVTDKIKVVFNMIIDGISQVVETVIEYAQQAFDFVEGIWNYIKVKLEQLYEWLAFLFQWPDIQRTAEVLTYSTNVFLDFLVSALDYAENGVSNWIDQIKDDLDAAVNAYLNELNNTDELGNIGEEYEEPVPEEENAAEHNPLYNPFKSNYKETTIKQKAYFEALADDSPIFDLVEKLKELANNFEFGAGKEAFDEAVGYFSDITENPDQALKLLLSGLIKVLEAVALFGLDFAKGVILSIFDIVKDLILAFKEIMNEEWEIPIVSAVYKFITGESLTFRPMNLLSYFVAIPATVIYKIIEGEAPFPDNASVTAFKEKYTVAYLEKRAGISSSFDLVEETEEENELVRTFFKVGYSITMFTQSFADIGTAISSSTGKENSILGYVSLGCAIFGGVFTNPWIVEINPAKLCSGDNDDDETSIAWMATAVTVLRGVAVYYAKKKNYISGETAVKVDELTKSVAGGINIIIYIVDYVGFQKDKKPKIFARNLCTTIPGSFLRFLSIKELNTDAYFIPVGILSVLIFSGYTSAFIINFSIDD